MSVTPDTRPQLRPHVDTMTDEGDVGPGSFEVEPRRVPPTPRDVVGRGIVTGTRWGEGRVPGESGSCPERGLDVGVVVPPQ